MNSLAALLSRIVTDLQRSDYCVAIRVLETQQYSRHQFAFKMRVELVTGDVLQIRIYCNDNHVDYSYQLLRGAQPIQRWDNKEHFPEIASHPYHFHSPAGKVEASPLTGDPTHDLLLVMRFLFAHDQADTIGE